MELAPDLTESVVVCDTSALELLHWSEFLPMEEWKVVNVHHVTDRVLDYGAALVFLIG